MEGVWTTSIHLLKRPGVPGFHMKSAPQEIMECHSCCMKVMARGDHKGWKGVQMKPNDALSFRWYCNKTACQGKYDEALVEAQAAWAEWSEKPEETPPA